MYIERDDFRETASKDFFRLAPGASVGLLKVTYPITCTNFTKDESTGQVIEIRATYDKPAEGEAFKKPKSYIHWVAESVKHSSPIKVARAILAKHPDSNSIQCSERTRTLTSLSRCLKRATSKQEKGLVQKVQARTNL